MARTNAILIIIIVCFPLLSISAGQNSGDKISEQEKRELEKKFEKLKTFHIADDGTVVYRMPEENTGNVDEISVPQVKVKVSVDEDGDYVVTTEEINPEYIKSEGEPNDDLYILAENTDALDIIPVEEMSEPDNDEKGLAGGESKKEVFKKKVSSYKSLEEAALAVDELLEELKRQQSEQASLRGRNSLSQKAAGGVDGTLRNGSYDLGGYSQPSYTLNQGTELDEDEPSYYINGVLSSKSEVDKIKSKDILKKVIKRSTSNPNGEWWIETRDR